MSSNEPSTKTSHMAFQEPDSAEQSIHLDPLSAHDLHRMQRELQSFLQLDYDHPKSVEDIEKWETVLQIPDVWSNFRKGFPELDVREDEVTDAKLSSVGRLQHVLLKAGLLRPALVRLSLETVDARQREQWLDWGYLLLPHCMHEPWHNLVNEEFGVEIAFVDTGFQDIYSDIDAISPDHRLAFQDRIFQKICSLWIWGKSHGTTAKSPAYQAFVRAYCSHRSFPTVAIHDEEM